MNVFNLINPQLKSYQMNNQQMTRSNRSQTTHPSRNSNGGAILRYLNDVPLPPELTQIIAGYDIRCDVIVNGNEFSKDHPNLGNALKYATSVHFMGGKIPLRWFLWISREHEVTISGYGTLDTSMDNALEFVIIGPESDFSKFDASRVEFAYRTFYGAKGNPSGVGQWNMSSCVSIVGFAQGAKEFKEDLKTWNTENVRWADEAFRSSKQFDSNLSTWNVEKFESAKFMFKGCGAFKGDLSGWKPRRLMNAQGMFREATQFASDLSAWELPKGCNVKGMFYLATAWLGTYVFSENAPRFGSLESSEEPQAPEPNSHP
jgi:hypothetical protein